MRLPAIIVADVLVQSLFLKVTTLNNEKAKKKYSDMSASVYIIIKILSLPLSSLALADAKANVTSISAGKRLIVDLEKRSNV